MNITNSAADVTHIKKFETNKSVKFKLKIPVIFYHGSIKGC